MKKLLDRDLSLKLLMLGVPPSYMSVPDRFSTTDLLDIIPITLSDSHDEYSLYMHYETDGSYRKWTICHYKIPIGWIDMKLEVYDKHLVTGLGRYLINLIERKIFMFFPVHSYEDDELEHAVNVVISMHKEGKMNNEDIPSGQEIAEFYIFYDDKNILLFRRLSDTVNVHIMFNPETKEYKIIKL